MQETCSGFNATCPEDKTADDGTSCGSNGLACASGRCTSLNLQCQNAGQSMNLTESCGQRGDSSCIVSCRDPRSSNQCVVLQTPLVDGSPCGYGGHCYNQTCEAGPWQDTAASWYKSNLQISVPVTVVAGLLALGILFWIARCCFRGCGCCGGRKRDNNRNTRPPPPNRQSMRQSGMAGLAVPPPQHPSRNSGASTDPMMGQYGGSPGGGGYGAPPPPPPQAYGGDPYGNGHAQGYDGGQGYGGGPGNNGWIDERLYNGQNYGRQEAWGR